MVDHKMSIFQFAVLWGTEKLMFKCSKVNYSGSLPWKTCKRKFTTVKKVNTKKVKGIHTWALKIAKYTYVFATAMWPYALPVWVNSHQINSKYIWSLSHTWIFFFFSFCGINKIPGHAVNISTKCMYRELLKSRSVLCLSGKQVFYIGNLGWAAHPSTAQITQPKHQRNHCLLSTSV